MTPDLSKYRSPVRLSTNVSACYSDQMMDLVFTIAGPFTRDDMNDPARLEAIASEVQLLKSRLDSTGITTLARGVEMNRLVITLPELMTGKAPAARQRPKTLEGLVPLALRIYLTVTNSSSALHNSKNKLRFLVVGPFTEDEMNSRDTLVTLAGERHPQCKPTSTLSFLAATHRHANLAEAVADGTVIVISLDSYNWRKLERTAAYQVQIEKGEETRRRQRKAAEEWRELNKQIRAEMGDRKGCTLSETPPFKVEGEQVYISQALVAEGTMTLSASSMAKLCAQGMLVEPHLLSITTDEESRVIQYPDGYRSDSGHIQLGVLHSHHTKELAYAQINEARAVIVGLRGMAPDADLDVLAANMQELIRLIELTGK